MNTIIKNNKRYRFEATRGAARGLTISVLVLSILIGTKSLAQGSFPTVTINLNYPQYQQLKLDGGHKYIDDAGMKGVILYRQDENTYIAYERMCSIEDQPAVIVDESGLFMKGCHSTYNLIDGYPSGGEAIRPLMKYKTILTGSTLQITDEVVF